MRRHCEAIKTLLVRLAPSHPIATHYWVRKLNALITTNAFLIFAIFIRTHRFQPKLLCNTMTLSDEHEEKGVQDALALMCEILA